MQPDALNIAVTIPTSTHVCGVKFSFDILPGTCFLCWKTSCLWPRPTGALCIFPLCLFQCDGTIYILLRHVAGDLYTRHRFLLLQNIIKTLKKADSHYPSQAESNQSAFYQQHQMLPRLFFKLGAPIASPGLISWSVKPLQTTDSIHVCSHLITAFVVWSLKAVKRGKTRQRSK